MQIKIRKSLIESTKNDLFELIRNNRICWQNCFVKRTICHNEAKYSNWV